MPAPFIDENFLLRTPTALAPADYEQLVELIARVRRDLHNPKLPFIIGQRPALSGGRDNAWRETIDAAPRGSFRTSGTWALPHSSPGPTACTWTLLLPGKSVAAWRSVT